VLAGLTPTKSGLLLAGDTHGNLLALNAKDGKVLKHIEAGGALNNSLISYSVGDEQYVAAAVGGATENPSEVAGSLRVVVYGLTGGDEPKVVTLDRLPAAAAGGFSKGNMLFVQACQQCHAAGGAGGSAPPLGRQSQLSDPELLRRFLVTVLPPMPVLYPSILNDDDVRVLAEYLRTDVFKCAPDAPQSCDPPSRPSSGGTKEWQAVYSVLTSPRCINCHPMVSKLPPLFSRYPQDYPRQGDDRHPHYYTVVRGDTVAAQTAERTGMVEIGTGTPFERFQSCHGIRNDDRTGIPGAEDPDHPGRSLWGLAPAAMAFESSPGVPLTGPELCARIKDKSRNGNRELADTLHHLATEHLVLWGFNPGKRLKSEMRTTPPIGHEELIAAFKGWMADGAPCPTE
jgi:mono/diheme cytochrome c family protein